jgi:hypothetical protein
MVQLVRSIVCGRKLVVAIAFCTRCNGYKFAAYSCRAWPVRSLMAAAVRDFLNRRSLRIALCAASGWTHLPFESRCNDRQETQAKFKISLCLKILEPEPRSPEHPQLSSIPFENLPIFRGAIKIGCLTFALRCLTEIAPSHLG